jgi:Nuclease-related domain
MYSETAGLSYENPDAPDARGDHSDDDQPEPELERVVSYPDTPAFPDPTAAVTDDAPDDDAPGDPARMPDSGGHDASLSDAVMPAVGIDALLDDADDDSGDDTEDDADDGGDDDGDPRADAPPLAMPRFGAPQPARPLLNRTTGSWPSPAESHEEARRTRAFGAMGGGGGAGPRVSRGSQPRRQRILDLAMDPRMRYWRERLVIMVIAGVIFGILWGWIGGLTLAIVAGIAHAVWRSRTVGSIPPGIKLTRAQRITQRKLTGLQRAGYRSLSARPIPDSEDVIDHFVVGPTGIYAIDSEKWNRKLPIRTRNGKQLWLGPASQKPRLEHAKWEAGRASELLSARLGRDVTVRPALAIYGPHIPWDIAVIRDVDVFNGDRLRKYLKRRSKVREVSKLGREDIAEIFEAAEEVLPFGLPASSEVVLSGG